MNSWYIVCTTAIVGFLIVSGCTSTAPPSTTPSLSLSPTSAQPAPPLAQSPGPSGTLTLRIDALNPGSTLPDTYTCKGTSVSPEVSWDGVPPGAKSLVFILDDPDAPAGTFTHWLVYNIPPKSGTLARAQPNAKVLDDGAQQGETSAGFRGYFPPCPPAGTTHRYVFRLFAVDMDISQPTADRDSIDRALDGHTIAGAEFLTVFKR